MRDKFMSDTRSDEWMMGYAIGKAQGRNQERERLVELLQILRLQAQERKLPQTANINSIITLIKGVVND
jgi:hypothetical protein